MLVACSKGTHSSLKRPVDSFSSSADASLVQTRWQASRAPLPKPWQEELMGKAGAQKAAAVEAKKTCSKWKLCSAKAGAAHTWAAQQHTSSREAAAAGPPCCLELLLHITGCILLPALSLYKSFYSAAKPVKTQITEHSNEGGANIWMILKEISFQSLLWGMSGVI